MLGMDKWWEGTRWEQEECNKRREANAYIYAYVSECMFVRVCALVVKHWHCNLKAFLQEKKSAFHIWNLIGCSNTCNGFVHMTLMIYAKCKEFQYNCLYIM